MRILLLLVACLSLQAIPIKNEKILICGVGKNIAHCLGNMIKKIEGLGGHFDDYHVIIYENNSTDNSAALLKKWARNNQKVTIISENLSPDQLSKRTRAHALRDQAPNRMELIAYARNQVLEVAMSKKFDNYKYLIMTDLDFNKGWEISGVLSSFKVTEKWDCLTANGVDYRGCYYDRYALRTKEEPLGPEFLGEIFWDNVRATSIKFEPSNGLYKVYSAFSGIAVYKREALRNCSYSGYITENFELLMRYIFDNEFSSESKQYKHYSRILGKKTMPLPLVFQQNSGYDGPVVCEHIPLYATMILNGYDKIFINPHMTCQYEI